MQNIPAISLLLMVSLWGCIPREVEVEADGMITDSRDGKTYAFVNIGTQSWLIENMNYTDKDSSGSWCYKGLSKNCDTYGRLYTWDAALKACPYGWRLPEDGDWKKLEIYLGMDPIEADSTNWRETGDVGIQLKAVWDWNSGGTGENTSRFTALPSGFREPNGQYYYIGDITTFWSSTYTDEAHAIGRALIYHSTGVYRWSYLKTGGYSVRCVKE